MVIAIFFSFVVFVIGLSFYLGNKTKTSSSYYAAGGTIHWAVNGVAFAGDYLSAASFLGICGMIATVGYDGFLYSIGYLAGWIVALFVVAEPMKRLGKFTFTDALDAKFNSKGIKLAAAISTLVVSVCYLIPQMVGAGVLVQPLLGLAHHWGVILVGVVVITIVATAGMASTTYVQFMKGAMLIFFSGILVVSVCRRGFSTHPDQGGKVPFYEYQTLTAVEREGTLQLDVADWKLLEIQEAPVIKASFARLEHEGAETWWRIWPEADGRVRLEEGQSDVVARDGSQWINGAPASPSNTLRQVGSIEAIRGDRNASSGPVGLAEFIGVLNDKETIVRRWQDARFTDRDGSRVIVYSSVSTPGPRLLRPGLKFKLEGTLLQRLDFLSLMLALFFGTAALPHILIRYYTVPSPSAARKSTIVAIAAIGAFYVMTLYMGLGAMVNGVMNPADGNMAAPLLARSFSNVFFAVISAIAFATVLGTVSGLIVAAAGAVAHDICDRFLGLTMDDRQKIRAGKISAFIIGGIAILLGIAFKGMNVSFLVGLAFAVAASANLPAIMMMLFWKRATAQGITASIIVGVVSSLTLIALSPDLFKQYGLDPTTAPIPFSNPGLITIPLSFLTLIVVSLLTPRRVEILDDN